MQTTAKQPNRIRMWTGDANQLQIAAKPGRIIERSWNVEQQFHQILPESLAVRLYHRLFTQSAKCPFGGVSHRFVGVAAQAARDSH